MPKSVIRDANLRCVVVGDGAVGKTSIISQYHKNVFPTDYTPTVFDNISTDVVVNGRLFHVDVWDTAGQEVYERLRPLSYPQAEIFVLVFSVVSPASFDNIKRRWFPEVTWYSPGVPTLLVGNRIDERDHSEDYRSQTISQMEGAGNGSPNSYRATGFITKNQGLEMARHIGAFSYIECSALTQVGLHDVFKEIVRCVAHIDEETKRKSKGCLVM
eukprot:TRINITY_DN21509_c0_g1_i1.p1 TRINITY_DN21509_c0_g1~~TRINITY_DN21509_c0_g1_i1.p1  ORF type:complete len:215 (-),score=32.75 TRINITY_DN21509_c0_g1_i1:103-747(-)